MEEWKEYKLGDVCSRLRSGKGIKSDFVFGSGLYPVIGGNGIRGYANEFNFKGECAVIGRQGAYCGNVRFFEGEAFMTEHAVVVVGNALADTRFLACLLSLMNLGNLSAQSAQPGLSVQTLSKQIIRLPSMDYQRHISAVIKSLDDKIECNRRINDNLEQQVSELYKSWKNGVKNNAHSYIRLDSIASFISGYSYKGTELVPSKKAMATIKNFCRNGGFKMDGYKEIEPSGKIKPEQYAEMFDVLVAHTDITQNADVIGNAEMVLSLGGYEGVIFSMDLVKVEPKSVFPYRFLLATILRDTDFKSYCMGYVNGTTVLHLSKKALPNYTIAIPDDKGTVACFDNCLSKVYGKMAEIISENTRLAQLRDTLLPRLMSGELKVNELK